MATGKNFNKIKKFELKRRHPRKKIIIRKRKFANQAMAKAKNIYTICKGKRKGELFTI